MRFPSHKCGLHLEHNANRNVYESVAEYIEAINYYDWQSDEHRQRAIDTNELWTLQWYPETPVGFNAVAAPTFEELMKMVQEEV